MTTPHRKHNSDVIGRLCVRYEKDAIGAAAPKPLFSNQALALFGFLGGVIYMIADYFIYLDSGVTGAVPDAAWQHMSIGRFTASVWLSILGTLLLTAGIVSLYRMVRQTCQRPLRMLTLLSAVCFFSCVTFIHFFVGCLEPMLYISMQHTGISTEFFTAMNDYMRTDLVPLLVAVIICFYLVLLVLIYGIFSGKFGLKKRVLGYVLLAYVAVEGIQCLILMPLGFIGVIGGAESLFEGFLFLIPWLYWKEKRKAGSSLTSSMWFC